MGKVSKWIGCMNEVALSALVASDELLLVESRERILLLHVIGCMGFVHSCLSHLQMVPSSQTQIRTLPSLERLVCRMAEVHLGWARTYDRTWAGSSTSRSHRYVLPTCRLADNTLRLEFPTEKSREIREFEQFFPTSRK